MAIVFTSAALLMTPAIFISDWTWMLQTQGLVVALHLGIVTAALSYWLFARGLKTVKVGNVATLSLAEPLTASLLGVLVLNEHLGMAEVLGILLIFSGIVVLAILPSRQAMDIVNKK
jgi:DME family drug/metabolite transporter